jgi:subtilase family serine protease
MNLSQANIRRLSVALTMGALVALGLLLYTPVFGGFPRDLITDRIDESRLVTVPRSVRFEAIPKNDRGPVPDSFPLPHMLLQLKRSPALESELVQYIDQLTDKKSPNFRHWLTAKEIGEKYGPSEQDLSTITHWLESHGFVVYGIHPNRMVIDFSGTAATMREGFHTEIHYLEVNGKTHFANMTNPKFPEALAPAVLGIVQIHDFAAHAHLAPKITNYYVSATLMPLVPADFQTIYNVDPLFRQGIHGEGQTINIVEDGDSYSNDIATYRSTFLGKYTGTVTTVHPSGPNACTDPGVNAADGEADLDGEISSAMAPNASIVLDICADTTTFGGLLALENLTASGSPPAIVSQSYGVCEAANYLPSNAAFSSAFQTAAAEGTSVFVSTGDNGSSECAGDFTGGDNYSYPGLGITGWGESVYNVAVGGTDFEDFYNAGKPANGGLPVSTYWSTTNTPTDGSAKSYIPEVPWNDSCAGYLIYNYEGYTASAGTSGFCNSTLAKTNNAFLSTVAAAGGPSTCATGGTSTDQSSYLEVADKCVGYAKPSWQSGVFGNPADGLRDIPDVAMFASNGFWGHYMVTCFSDTGNGGTSCAGAPSTWSGFGGTSVATPMLAGIQALVNQYRHLTNVGNPNPTYYAIANAEFGASGNSNCYSVNIGTNLRRGMGSACVFNDITQGDNDTDCRRNGTSHEVNCYLPNASTTEQGATSTQPLTTVTVLTAGTGYTSAPTCKLGAPPNLNQYLPPPGQLPNPIWAGGAQATCTANLSGSTVGTITLNVAGNGYTGGTSCTLTGGGGSGATCVASATVATLAPTYQPAWGATPGWDFATGLGSVNAYNLAMAPQW